MERIDINVALLPPLYAMEETNVNTTLNPNEPRQRDVINQENSETGLLINMVKESKSNKLRINRLTKLYMNFATIISTGPTK